MLCYKVRCISICSPDRSERLSLSLFQTSFGSFSLAPSVRYSNLSLPERLVVDRVLQDPPGAASSEDSRAHSSVGSSLTPSQIPSFLGASLDIPRLLTRPLPHRVEALQSLVQEITVHSFSPTKTWQVFLGHLASFTDLIPLCRLFMRPLQLHFLKFFSPRRDNPSRLVPLSPQVKSLCLLWGSQEFLLQGKSFSPPPPRLSMSTDVSNLGWGAFLHPYHVSGIWSPQEAHLHINSLLAVFLALQSFEELISEQSIMIRSDNSTVVSYINHQEGTHSPSLCNLTSVLWDRCRERGIHLLASHVPGENNLLADFLSRGKFLPSEWTLNHSVFQRICLIFPTPEIDLFASALTFQLPKYCLRVQDLQAWAIDAMSFPWSDLRLYAFPPFSLLPRVLQKVAQDEADLLLIAPHWPQRPWFLRLLSLLVDFLRSLPPLPDLVHQPISLCPHPHPDRLHLSLWPLSGNVAKRQAFLRGLPTLSPTLLGHPPDALMTIDWQASLNGVPSLCVIRILPL